MRPPVTLRPVRADDADFLYRLYASTREEELRAAPWNAAQKDAFLRQQHTAQTMHYRAAHPDGDFRVVDVDGRPAGRLYVDRRPDEVRIVDISLLPEHRDAGLGSALLRDVLAEAQAARRRVTIHVERFNPALSLYRRLGFAQVEDRGVYLFLAWRPPS